MCGISGLVTAAQDETPPLDLVRIVNSQSVRGPDSVGYSRQLLPDGRAIWLAHNRLSIIDLSAAGNQPFVAENGRYTMVFNGAIYNYIELRRELEACGRSFRSSSDTEVLLEAFAQWGINAFSKFLGMFAVAIYDAASQKLTLARDRFGVKPLYYVADKSVIRFASTATELASSLGLEINLEYVGRGIKYKYYEDETDISPYVDLKSLPSGNVLVVDLMNNDCRLIRYFDLEDYCKQEEERLSGIDLQSAVEELRAMLQEATAIRLRADVKIGLSLSGGVDSASIALLCKRLGMPPRAYSFGSPTDRRSEGPLVKSLSRHFSMPVVFVDQAVGAAAESLFWRTMRAQGAPIPHTSQLAQYAIFEAARKESIKVMLGGQGGDEAFMGYRKYFLYHARNVVAERSWREVPSVLGNSVAVLPSVLRRANVFWAERHRYVGNVSGDDRQEIQLPPLTRSRSPGAGMGLRPSLRQALDVSTFSLPSLLRYEDRNSMGNGIESRLPFLDHRVIGFGLALPTALKLRHGMGKYVLRMAMCDGVPREVIFNRQKRGFDTRHADWIHNGVGRAIRGGLEQNISFIRSLLPRSSALDEYFSDHSLSKVAGRFSEATSLLWMADPTFRSYPE